MISLSRTRAGVTLAGAAAATLIAACGGETTDRPAEAGKAPSAAPPTTVLNVRAVPPGTMKFDRQRLRAKAGRIKIVFENPEDVPHNVRIQTGDKCCFKPGQQDVGGTEFIGKGRTEAIVDLKPGKYTFVCTKGGHWQRGMHGTLTVE